jgi:hypothetical protein
MGFSFVVVAKKRMLSHEICERPVTMNRGQGSEVRDQGVGVGIGVYLLVNFGFWHVLKIGNLSVRTGLNGKNRDLDFAGILPKNDGLQSAGKRSTSPVPLINCRGSNQAAVH